MKTFVTTLATILIIFVLLILAGKIFGYEFKFIKTKQEVIKQEVSKETENINKKNMPEEKNNQNTEENKQPLKDITELSAQILKPGTGERQVKAGDKITVHYTGMLLDGTKFDSSVDRGKPFSLTIGVGQVIPGWDKGIVGMKVGEQRRLFIPSELAYGERGAGNLIKPNDDLVFDVQLISIDNQEENVDNINNKENESATTTKETENDKGE